MRTDPSRSRFPRVTLGDGSGEESAAPHPAWPLARPDYASLEAAVQGEAARWNVPGISVAVLHEGAITPVAVGVTNLETRQPMTTDTISQIGSISKVFATTVVMQLVDEGKIDLDAPVTTYVPELPLADAAARANLTMRHLLSHTGGFEGDRFLDYGRGDDATTKSMLAMDTLQQWFQPGELFSYCNVAFYLVALVIERVTGEVAETVVQQRLFDPLKLEGATYFAEDAITRPHAIGHFLSDRNAGPKIARPYSFPRHVNLCGNIVATATHLARFAQMHMNDGELDGERIISPESAQLMRTPFIDAGAEYRTYGQGWCIWDYPDLKTVEHGGATMGFRAHLTTVPQKGFAIATLTNADSGAAAIQDIEAWALDHYLGFARPKPAETSRKKQELERFTGIFSRHDTRTTVTRRKKHLEVSVIDIDERTGKEEEEARTFSLVPIEPAEANRFQVPEGPYLGMVVDFLESPTKDHPDRLLMRVGGRLSERFGAAGAGVDGESDKGDKDTKKSGKKK
ncbi:MAG: serine hydrolase domain-containing protein [Thermomicrobiales bacterium]